MQVEQDFVYDETEYFSYEAYWHRWIVIVEFFVRSLSLWYSSHCVQARYVHTWILKLYLGLSLFSM